MPASRRSSICLVPPPELSGPDRERLLAWARSAIVAAVTSCPGPRIDPAELDEDLLAPHAAFVTIREEGELRGCIGSLDFGRPLWRSVLDAAASAALDDPRFRPVEPVELPRLRLSISVLQPPVDLPDPADFEPMVHGIIVERDWHRARLLPTVAGEFGWGARETLDAVCHKAGLPADAWRDRRTRLKVFSALEFDEEPAPAP